MFAETASDTAIIWHSSVPQARETLLLDIDHSPLLEELYLKWRGELKESEARGVLENLNHYLRTFVFDLSLCKREAVIKLVGGAKALPLEYFIENKTGVCRHFSLTAYYFLERMRKEDFLPIISNEIICKDLGSGRHAWVSVELKDGSFHFDPYWGILIKEL